MADYDHKKSNAWLVESSNNPRWVGTREEAKPREKVALNPEPTRMKIAEAIAAQGFIPHHETGVEVAVASVAEALIIIDYVRRVRADTNHIPQQVPLMNEDEEAEVNRWLQTGRM
jgi:hypothetical protein